LGKGIEVGESRAALGPQRLGQVQNFCDPPLLHQRRIRERQGTNHLGIQVRHGQALRMTLQPISDCILLEETPNIGNIDVGTVETNPNAPRSTKPPILCLSHYSKPAHVAAVMGQ
jgi:hypothetical protein